MRNTPELPWGQEKTGAELLRPRGQSDAGAMIPQGGRFPMVDKDSQIPSAWPEIFLSPVGFVRSAIKEPRLVAGSKGIEPDRRFDNTRGQTAEVRNLVSELIIDRSLKGILDGIEDFSHLLVLYWPHLVPSEGRTLTKVHPMGRKDLPLVGVFCTCSPARPNPILVTAVRLLEREDNVLRVSGLEAVDGSPIIDIKPYVPSYYSAVEVRLSKWMVELEKDAHEA